MFSFPTPFIFLKNRQQLPIESIKRIETSLQHYKIKLEKPGHTQPTSPRNKITIEKATLAQPSPKFINRMIRKVLE